MIESMPGYERICISPLGTCNNRRRQILRLYNNDKKSDAMRTIDVSALIDGARFNAFHARVLFWCALIIIFDGYDLVIYGVV